MDSNMSALQDFALTILEFSALLFAFLAGLLFLAVVYM